MTALPPLTDSLAAFARLANDFCDLVERRDTLGRGPFLAAVHMRLAPLYAAALALPAIEVVDETSQEQAADDAEGREVDVPACVVVDRKDRMSADEWMALYRAMGALIGEGNHYRQVFNPYAEPPEEPVTGRLADDVADIYQDLADGLVKWRRGEVDAALWEWRYRFTMHWGEHVTSALRALHALADQQLGFPRPRADV